MAMKDSFESQLTHGIKPPWLYHATVQKLNGEPLQPRPNWTCTRGEFGKFVFAGASLEAAYCYALKTSGCMSCGTLQSDDGMQSAPYILFNSREDFYAENPKGNIYKLSPESFENVPRLDGQSFTKEWIAREAVSPIEIIFVDGINDSMSKGVQFLFLKRNPDNNEREVLNRDPSLSEMLALIKTGCLDWENQTSNIGIFQPLLKAFEETQKVPLEPKFNIPEP